MTEHVQEDETSQDDKTLEQPVIPNLIHSTRHSELDSESTPFYNSMLLSASNDTVDPISSMG
jgi:hypothetical protein